MATVLDMTDGPAEYINYDSGLNGSRATLVDSFAATNKRELGTRGWWSPPFADNPLWLRHFPRNLQDTSQKVGSGSCASSPKNLETALNWMASNYSRQDNVY